MLNLYRTLLPPRSGGHYNFQIAHARFKPDLQHELLPKLRTFYTTIMRSPIKRFISAFSYFGEDRHNVSRWIFINIPEIVTGAIMTEITELTHI